MIRNLLLVVFTLALLVPAAAQPPAGRVVLDVVALDGDGRAVTNLRQEDFQVQDDGKAVTIDKFTIVLADGADRPRSIVVVLDDAGVPAAGTQALRAIAQNLLSRMGPADNIGIVRLHDTAANVATDPDSALAVINKFMSGTIPYDASMTPETTLTLMGSLARRLEPTPGQRKAVVCIGSPAVCSMPEVISTAPRGLWPSWVGAIDAAADANVAVYSIVPTQMQAPGLTLHGMTGGEIFTTTSGFEGVFSRIWNDLSHYYLLEYQPKSSARDITTVNVRVNRRGVQLRTRGRRGAPGPPQP
jgi:VWFA-related protein